MLTSLFFGAVLLFAGKDPQVVGTWGMGGATILWINADGTGEMEGESFKWSTDKGVLSIVASSGESDQIGYAVKGGRLVVSMDGTPITLDKMGGGSSAAAPDVAPADPVKVAPAKAEPKAAAPAKAGKDELSQFLLKNAWCSMSFNVKSGYSSKSRAQFFQDGTFSMASQGEGYSSGYGGTMASQSNTGDGGEWKVVSGKLMIKNADTGNQWVQQALEITRNSNGSPIIKSGGKEYMVCQ